MAPENDLDAEQLSQMNFPSGANSCAISVPPPGEDLSPANAAVVPVENVACCPFHDGAATLDLLLAELDPRDREVFDAALDLRFLAVAGEDAGACAAQLFRVRQLLADRHYLAFYRV